MRALPGGDDAGSVTAEFAVVLPAVMAVVVLTLGAMGATARQVRLEQGVAQGARLAARGEPDALVGDAVTRAVGDARAVLEEEGDLVCVSATAPAGLSLPVGLLRARACALAEVR